MKRCVFCAVRLFIPVFLAAWAGPAFGDAFLVENGRPQAQIVIAPAPPRAVKLAASELREYIRRISGAELPVVSEPLAGYPVRIFVGRSAHTDRLGLDGDDLRHGAFRVVSRVDAFENGEKWLALLGRDRDFTPPEPFVRSGADIARATAEWDRLTGETWGFPYGGLFRRYHQPLDLWDFDERGSLNAVYEFLRELGVRWYMPGKLGEIVPERATILLPAVSRETRPDFPVRFMGGYTPHWDSGPTEAVLYNLRQGFNPGQETMGVAFSIGNAHALNLVHERAEVKKAHPEYYLLQGDGERATGHMGDGAPCLGSPGLFESTVKLARAMFDLYPDYQPAWSILPADGYVYPCKCELCKGLDTPERGYRGMLSDYVWGFVDRVARELHKTHPDRLILCAAYGSFVLPPVKIDRFSPNLAVWLVQPRADFHNQATRDEFMAVRRGFLEKLAPGNFFIGTHYLSGRNGRLTYFPRRAADDLYSLRGVSRGEFIELVQGEGSAMHAPGFNHLNVYVTGRLYWDAGLDLDALLEEYYRLFYGPAAAQMKAFIEYAEQNWPRMSRETEPVDRALALLAEAREAAGTEVYGERVQLLVDYVPPLREARDRLARGRENNPVAVAARWQKAGVTLDGRLDEPAWQDATPYRLGAFRGREPQQASSLRIAWAEDEQALYFGIHCAEPDTAGMEITAREHGDTNIFLGENIEILLETPAHSYYQVAVSPAGAIVDLDRSRGTDSDWASNATAAVHLGNNWWSMEVRVPAMGEEQKTILPRLGVAGNQPSAAAPWHFNVFRQRLRDGAWDFGIFSPADNLHDWLTFGRLTVK